VNQSDVEVNKTRTVGATPVDEAWPDGGYLRPGSTFVDRDGTYKDHLLFACPGCGRMGAIRTYSGEKKPGAWKIEAGSLDDPKSLTLSPSINCVGCCGWHGYLRNGVYVSC